MDPRLHGCTLLELRVARLEPARIEASLSKLGLEVDVALGDAPKLAAVLAAPKAPGRFSHARGFFRSRRSQL